MPTSIWNENPEIYNIIKRIFSSFITVLYPIAFYCVLTRSRTLSKVLQKLLLLHVSCISFQWIVVAWLADAYSFFPMKVTRFDGVLRNYFDATVLYSFMYITYFLSIGSCLLIYFNRLFIIKHIYVRHRTLGQKVYEFSVYAFVYAYSTIPIGVTISQIPDQTLAKLHAVQILKYLPDCINASNVVIACDVLTDCMPRTSRNYIIWLLSISFIMISSTIYTSIKVSHASRTESSANRIRHTRFHRNTFFQAFFQIFFATVPYSIANISVLLQIAPPYLIYFIDFISENHATSGIISLFLFYDPYKEYITKITSRSKRQNVIVIFIR